MPGSIQWIRENRQGRWPGRWSPDSRALIVEFAVQPGSNVGVTQCSERTAVLPR